VHQSHNGRFIFNQKHPVHWRNLVPVLFPDLVPDWVILDALLQLLRRMPSRPHREADDKGRSFRVQVF